MDNYIYCNDTSHTRFYDNVDKYSKHTYLGNKTLEELQLNSYKHYINKNKTSAKHPNPPRPYFINNVEMQKPLLQNEGIFERDLKIRIEGPLTLKETQIYGPLTTDTPFPFRKFNTLSLQEDRCTWNQDNNCKFPYTKEHLENPATYGPLENDMKSIYINNIVAENNKRQSMKNIIQEDMDALFNF